MKRIATFVLTAVLALTVLAGCPKKVSEPKTQDQQKMKDMMKKSMEQMQKSGKGPR